MQDCWEFVVVIDGIVGAEDNIEVVLAYHLQIEKRLVAQVLGYGKS